MKDLSMNEVATFFDNDEHIKKMLIYSVPDETDFYNEDATIKYQDRLYELLKGMKTRFQGMTKIFDSQALNEKMEEIFNNYETELAECGTNKEKLTNFYRKKLTTMTPSLVEDIDKTCIGYSIKNRSPERFLDKCNSVNDILHTIHTCAINNEEFYKSIPKIEEKNQENSNRQINFYGEEFDLSREIFDKFPFEINNGNADITDILSLKNQRQIYIMIRGLGHALTMNINAKNPDSIMTKYYIPKICNAEKVNKLLGVKKVSEDAKPNDYTVGQYEEKREDYCDKLFEFLDRVPTDDDLPRAIEFKESRKNEIVEEKEEQSQNLPMVTNNTFPEKIKNKLRKAFYFLSRIGKKDESITQVEEKSSAKIAHDRLVEDLARQAKEGMNQEKDFNKKNELETEKKKDVEKNFDI